MKYCVWFGNSDDFYDLKLLMFLLLRSIWALKFCSGWSRQKHFPVAILHLLYYLNSLTLISIIQDCAWLTKITYIYLSTTPQMITNPFNTSVLQSLWPSCHTTATCAIHDRSWLQSLSKSLLESSLYSQGADHVLSDSLEGFYMPTLRFVP